MSIGIKNICKHFFFLNIWKTLSHRCCSIISQKLQSPIDNLKANIAGKTRETLSCTNLGDKIRMRGEKQ